MRISTAAWWVLAVSVMACTTVHAQEEVDATLEFANGLLLRGLNEEAAEEYRRYLDAAGAAADPEAWYRLGEAAFAAGAYEDAQQALEAYRSRAAGGRYAERAGVRLAESLQRLNRLDEAVALFEEMARDATDPSVRAASLYGLGRAGVDRGDLQGAIRPLTRLIEDYPSDARVPFARFHLARAYQDLDEPAEAARLFESVADDARTQDAALRHESLLRAAENHARAGEHARAAQVYDALANAAAGTEFAERAGYGRAWAAHAAEDYEAAATHAADFLARYPESVHAPAAHYLQGHARQELGQHEAARVVYERLIATAPDSEFARRAATKLAWVHYLEGDAEAARAQAARLMAMAELAPNDAGDAQYLVALLDADAGALEAALSGFARVATEFPGSAFAKDAEYKRAEILARLGRTAEAADAFAAFSLANPEHTLAADALLRGADAAFADADFAEAIAQYEQVLAAAPEPTVEELTRYRLALAHHNARQFPESVQAFETLLERFPDSDHAAEAHLRMGESRLEDGDAQRARASFEQVLSSQADAALLGRARRGVALAHYQLGALDEAAAAFSNLLQSHPEVGLDRETLLWLGQYQFDKERFSEAANAFHRLLDATPPPDNPGAIQFKLAECLERLERHDDASAAFAQVQEVEPDSAWALDASYRQALMLEKQGDTAAARAKYEAAARVLEGEAPARARLRLAAMDAEAGDHAAAARNFMMVAVLYDDAVLTPAALLGAGMAYEQAGDGAKARTCFEELIRDHADSAEAPLARARLEALAGGG